MKNAVFFGLCLLCNSALAQPGRLDSGFGTGGKLTTDFDGNIDLPLAVLALPDGRILAGGSSVNNAGIDTDMALAMYLSDGSPDPSFSGDGLNKTSIGGSDVLRALALQPDGKILAAATRLLNANYDIALVRYLPNGAFDSDFGTFFGVTNFDLGSDSDIVYDMVLLPDGKIVLAGAKGAADNGDFFLIRFTSDGIVDSTFGDNGIVLTDFAGKGDFAYSLQLQSDGKLVAAGKFTDLANYDNNFGVARYLPDGTLDPDFGTGGKQALKIVGIQETANDLAILPDGKIVLAGRTNPLPDVTFAMARLNADGSPDLTFADSGALILDFDQFIFANALAVQPDGKYLIGGTTLLGSFLLARVTAEGEIDSVFTDGGSTLPGWVQTNFSSPESNIRAMAMQPDGNLVAVGPAGNDFGVARYLVDGNVGIEKENFDAAILIYPNPGRDVLHISLTGTDRFDEVELRTVQGQRVLAQRMRGLEADLNVGHLPAQPYVVMFLQKGAVIHSRLWLKQ